MNAALADAGFEAQGSPKLPNVTMGKAEHASDDYEFVRAKKAKDARAYSSTLHIGTTVVRAVTSYMEGGVIGLAEAALSQVVHTGLLPGASAIGLMLISRTVVRMVDGMLHGRPYPVATPAGFWRSVGPVSGGEDRSIRPARRWSSQCRRTGRAVMESRRSERRGAK